MSTYIVGDIQGCYLDLKHLLAEVAFAPGSDTLIVAGDLINRGPDNLSTIKLLQDLGASCVLGNHDLHFLAVAAGVKTIGRSDTFQDLLESDQLPELLAWFCELPLILALENHQGVVVHAGIPHIWSTEVALDYAREVEAILQQDLRYEFFQHMYGNEPETLNGDLSDMDRARVITNYLTRMRFCGPQGELELTSKEDQSPEGFAPWFSYPRQDHTRVYFGHWAAIGGVTNSEQCIGLDTGCVWGRALTAVRVEDNRRFSVAATKSVS